MDTIIIDGKATAAAIRAELGEVISAAVAQGRRAPGLAVILVGEDPASQVYVRNKEKACAETGMSDTDFHEVKIRLLQVLMLELFRVANGNDAVAGQLPGPARHQLTVDHPIVNAYK